MSDLSAGTDTSKEIPSVENPDGVFEGRRFPSEKEIEELYISDLKLGAPFTPLSVIYYTDKDIRDVKNEANNDLREALKEQGQIVDLLRRESVEESRFAEVVAIIKSPSGWKEIAYMLKNMRFGEKTLAYFEGRLCQKEEETQSIEGIIKLLKSNLKQQAQNGTEYF